MFYSKLHYVIGPRIALIGPRHPSSSQVGWLGTIDVQVCHHNEFITSQSHYIILGKRLGLGFRLGHFLEGNLDIPPGHEAIFMSLLTVRVPAGISTGGAFSEQ